MKTDLELLKHLSKIKWNVNINWDVSNEMIKLISIQTNILDNVRSNIPKDWKDGKPWSNWQNGKPWTNWTNWKNGKPWTNWTNWVDGKPGKDWQGIEFSIKDWILWIKKNWDKKHQYHKITWERGLMWIRWAPWQPWIPWPAWADYIPWTWTVLVDETDPLYIYRGEANIWSSTANPLWRIRRFTISNKLVQWAWWVNTFTNIWDNHLTLTYSQ